MEAPCWWWGRNSQACRSLFFLSLRCVFVFQSLIAESGCPHFGPLEHDAINPSSQTSLTTRDQLDKRRTNGAGCCSKQKKTKKNCLLAAVTVNTCQQMEQYQIISFFIQLDTDRNSEAIKPTHGFLHAPLLPGRPLSFPWFFFFFELFVTRDSPGKTISFYTFIGVIVNRVTVL